MDTRISHRRVRPHGPARRAPRTGVRTARSPACSTIDLNAAGKGLTDGAWRDVRRRHRLHDAARRDAGTCRATRPLGSTRSSARRGGTPIERPCVDLAEHAGIGVVAAPNFSIGAVLFEAMAAHAAARLRRITGLRRLAARDSSRQEDRRAVGHGARHQGRDGARRLHREDRRRPARARASCLAFTPWASTGRRRQSRSATACATAAPSRAARCSPRDG